MSSRKLYVMTIAVVLTVFMASGCTFYNKLKARDHLNKGVQAYEAKDYVTADEHFTQSIQLDPELLHAWLYKATTYRVQVIPNVYTEDNKKRATDAIKAFQDVLKKDDKNINAIASIASLYTDPLQDHEKAEEWHRTRLRINPKDPEPLYGIAVMDFGTVNEKTGQTGENVENLSPEEKAQLNEQADAGIAALKQALEIKPEYTDAMQYLNLLYREKAKLTEDKAEKQRWLREADTLAIEGLKLQRKQQEELEMQRKRLKASTTES